MAILTPKIMFLSHFWLVLVHFGSKSDQSRKSENRCYSTETAQNFRIFFWKKKSYLQNMESLNVFWGYIKFEISFFWPIIGERQRKWCQIVRNHQKTITEANISEPLHAPTSSSKNGPKINFLKKILLCPILDPLASRPGMWQASSDVGSFACSEMRCCWAASNPQPCN